MDAQSNPTVIEPTAERDEFVRGLREVADFLAEHPEIDFYLHGTALALNWYCPNVEELAAAARVLGRADKETDERYLNLVRRFGPHQVKAWTLHDGVCERVVVGTETVTKEVPDPERLAEVPTVTVTETVEQVEWRCPPSLLSAVAS